MFREFVELLGLSLKIDCNSGGIARGDAGGGDLGSGGGGGSDGGLFINELWDDLNPLLARGLRGMLWEKQIN